MSNRRTFIATHLRLAHDAFEGARVLASAGNRNAVYLAQQAVEQIVLALAMSEGVNYARPMHHQIRLMLKAIPRENPLRDHLMGVAWLEAYASTYRYPKASGRIVEPPSNGDFQKACAVIDGTLEQLLNYYEVDLRSDHKPARFDDPPRAADPDSNPTDCVDYVHAPTM